MKKFTSLLFTTIAIIVFVIPNASGQITLTQADMPSAGITVSSDSDLSPTVLPGNKGTNQTWNLSAFKANKWQSLAFVTASSTPNGASFPSANLADSTYGKSGYNYFSSTTGAFSVAGVSNVAGYPVIIPLNPVFEQIALPANYNNNFGGTSYGKSNAIAIHVLSFDSAKGSIHITYTDTIDGWGSVTTPGGTFNALRVKHYEVDIDSLFTHSAISHTWFLYQAQETKIPQYIWYTNGLHYPVASLTMDSTNTKVQKGSWYAGPAGIDELSHDTKTLIYPNPCSTQVTFQYSAHDAKYLSVFDVTGRQLIETDMKNGTSLLNTSAYAKGIYIYKVSDLLGNILDRGKFLVQ